MRRRCGHRGDKRTWRKQVRRAGGRRRVTIGVAAAILVAVLIARAASPAAAAWRPLCGFKSGPPPSTYQHVVVIMDENKSFSDIIGRRGSAARRHAPFLNHLAAKCGLATNYRAITHPSHPNYMAVTGGIRTMQSYHNGPNIFRQVRRSGRTWRSYNQSMPEPCLRSTVGPYKAGHNPGIAWSRIARDCLRWDVGTWLLRGAIAENHLPAYAFITPDQCHNMHASCERHVGAIRAGDKWLHEWIRALVNTPDYVAGRTAIFVTWDEGSHGQSAEKRGENCLARIHRHDETCHIPTFVLSAYVRPGTRSDRFFSHYSLLHTTERLLGFHRFIAHADDATTVGMRVAFGM